jgi:ferric-dicitrate binding protein FerR (iron transport regulator)
MKIDNTIQELWELFISDKASPEQLNALFEQINSANNDDDHITYIKEAISKIPQSFYKTDDTVIHSILEAIISSNDDLKASLDKDIQPPVAKRIPILRKWAWAAASAILLTGIGAYLWTYNKKNPLQPVVSVNTADIRPGKNGGILTLADGRQVLLDSTGNGVIATQNGAQVLLKNGQLAYVPTGESAVEMVYNMVSTPKGRQFSLLLPDGTKAWLNAASSLRYPTMFVGDQRRVEVTGEVYFEVSRNARMPFRVNVNNKVEVEVLGTHFDVDAYENEANIATTLLEGSIIVSQSSDRQQQPSSHGRAVTLKPGQQAQIAGSDRQDIKVITADIDKTMAWKNGLFYFDGADLYYVMQQIERWYDIEVVYEKGVRNGEFVGKLTRDVTLNQLLEGFKEFGIHYKLEGRRLTLLP